MNLNHSRFTETRYKFTNRVNYDFENCAVKEIVNFLNSQQQDQFVGHTHGINAVNQEKHYISINALGDIRNIKFYGDKYHVPRGGKNRFSYTQQMAYYLLQDPDFVKWMNEYEGVVFDPR